jgi:hypothetical protein
VEVLRGELLVVVVGVLAGLLVVLLMGWLAGIEQCGPYC